MTKFGRLLRIMKRHYLCSPEYINPVAEAKSDLVPCRSFIKYTGWCRPYCHWRGPTAPKNVASLRRKGGGFLGVSADWSDKHREAIDVDRSHKFYD